MKSRKTRTAAAADAMMAAPGVPTMTKVMLSRTVTLSGHDYKPGVEHTVDADTLAALGDAVLTPRPVV